MLILGTSGNPDDLKLLTSSVKALRISAVVCEKYAKKYDVLFNDRQVCLLFINVQGHQLNEDIY